jgi:phospholipase C
MKLVKTGSQLLRALRIGLGSLALLQMSVGPTLAAAASSVSAADNTQSPIKHLIVIIGENRSFDHVFATYEPARGQKVWNLLSEEIVKRDGTPGRKFYKAEQHAAPGRPASGVGAGDRRVPAEPGQDAVSQ